MSARIRVGLWFGLAVAVNTIGWLVEFPGWTDWLSVIPAAICGAMLGRALIGVLDQRRNARGRNRRTEADHPDPEAVGTTGLTLNPGGTFTFTFNPVAVGSGEDPGLTVDEVSEDMPILAHRYARILPTNTGLTFASMNPMSGITFSGSGSSPSYPHFSRDADAACDRRIHLWNTTSSTLDMHRAPKLGCTCGFYAVPADQLPKWEKTFGGVSLLVELSGTVIEHETGYRAEHQRVLEWIPPSCQNCGEPAVKAWRVGSELLWDCGGHEMLPPANSKAPIFALTLDHIAGALGVPHAKAVP